MNDVQRFEARVNKNVGYVQKWARLYKVLIILSHKRGEWDHLSSQYLRGCETERNEEVPNEVTSTFTKESIEEMFDVSLPPD